MSKLDKDHLIWRIQQIALDGSVDVGVEAECQRLIDDLDGLVLVPEGWAKVAKCPDGRCKDGVVPHQIGEFEWEPEQCQFCYEKDEMLNAYKEGSDE